MPESLLGGIDAGGTTFKIAVARSDGKVLSQTRVPTTTPEATIDQAVTEMRRIAIDAGGDIQRFGIASFGPVNVDSASPDYGTILQTPKPGWSGIPLLERFQEALGVPGALDSDVNAALAAEARWGAARGFERAAYVTVGTGIGVGVLHDGVFAARPYHPELGHIRVERFAGDDYAGRCPFHGACLEGMSAAPALIDRYGRLEDLEWNSAAWNPPAFYLAQLCLTLTLAFRTERIILGGGVSQAAGLIEHVRTAYDGLLAGYVAHDESAAPLIARAGLGDNAGVLGGCALAMNAG